MAIYKIDAAHSEIKFKVKHLMITNVTGSFTKFDATLESEKEDFTDAKINFEADVDSINTNQEQRDADLKSADFFDAAEYPKLTFVSKELQHKGDTDYKLIGDLTIRGITKEVALDVEHGGAAVDPYGQSKIGFELNGKISRAEFGLKWGAVTEAGGVVVGDEIKLMMEVQFIKQ